MVDIVVDRANLKNTIARALRHMVGEPEAEQSRFA